MLRKYRASLKKKLWAICKQNVEQIIGKTWANFGNLMKILTKFDENFKHFLIKFTSLSGSNKISFTAVCVSLCKHMNKKITLTVCLGYSVNIKKGKKVLVCARMWVCVWVSVSVSWNGTMSNGMTVWVSLDMSLIVNCSESVINMCKNKLQCEYEFIDECESE